MKRDYYRILEVGREATESEVKRSFRRLAFRYHPDKNRGNRRAEERFKEINEAYEVLRDPRKRALYNHFGHEEATKSAKREGRSRRPGPSKGKDLRYDLEISLEQAALGGEVSVEIPRVVICLSCKGSGSKKGYPPRPCRSCLGKGEIRRKKGPFEVSEKCPRCKGEGHTIPFPCSRCKGRGGEKKSTCSKVPIPPGAMSGERIRVVGHGEGGSPPGDLLVTLFVKKHPLFLRKEKNLYCEVPITFAQAALGDKIEIPTLEGMGELFIPPGTPSHHIFPIKGKGVLGEGDRGDLIVKIIVEVPTRLSREEKKILKEFARLSGEKSTPRGRKFWEKMKGIFGKEEK